MSEVICTPGERDVRDFIVDCSLSHRHLGASKVVSPSSSVRLDGGGTSARLRTCSSWSGVLVSTGVHMAHRSEQARRDYQLAYRQRNPNYGRRAAAREAALALQQQGLRRCSRCAVIQPLAEFYRYRTGRMRAACRTCIRTLSRSPEVRARARAAAYHRRPRTKAHNRFRTTGFTQELWDAAWLMQNGRCAICQCCLTTYHNPHVSKGPKMCADHDHALKRPRGILCSTCNKALGFFKDSPDRLRAAIAYLADPPLSVLV